MLNRAPVLRVFAINNIGEIVGTAYISSKYDSDAFLYSGGFMIDLNTLIPSSTWTLQAAEAINDCGQIVCNGYRNGQTHALLLTPVPEPSTLALLGAGAIGLIGYKRQRRQKSNRNQAKTGPAILFFPSHSK